MLVGVLVGVCVGVQVGVLVGVEVLVGVLVFVGVGVLVAVGVLVGVMVGLPVPAETRPSKNRDDNVKRIRTIQNIFISRLDFLTTITFTIQLDKKTKL